MLHIVPFVRLRSTNMVVRTKLAATVQIDAWEYEGGAQPGMPLPFATTLVGIASARWNGRKESGLESTRTSIGSPRPCGQFIASRAASDRPIAAVIAILEEERIEVMSRDQAAISFTTGKISATRYDS